MWRFETACSTTWLTTAGNSPCIFGSTMRRFPRSTVHQLMKANDERCDPICVRSYRPVLSGSRQRMAVLPSEQVRFALATLDHFKGNPAIVFSFGKTALDIFRVAVASSGIV